MGKSSGAGNHEIQASSACNKNSVQIYDERRNQTTANIKLLFYFVLQLWDLVDAFSQSSTKTALTSSICMGIETARQQEWLNDLVWWLAQISQKSDSYECDEVQAFYPTIQDLEWRKSKWRLGWYELSTELQCKGWLHSNHWHIETQNWKEYHYEQTINLIKTNQIWLAEPKPKFIQNQNEGFIHDKLN